MKGTIIIATLLVLSIASSLPAQSVLAHPFTEETIPSMSSNAPIGTTEVIVFFTEHLDINFSQIRVFDSNGYQVDNGDTRYYQGESSLIVTTSPLQEGTYTASTKALSKVDGHLVPDAFLFGVGSAVVTPHPDGQQPIDETLFLPGAGAKLPGLIGQTIVLGAVFASLVIWGTQNKQLIRDAKNGMLEKMQQFYREKFMAITGVGIVLVFASDMLIIAVQSIMLETTPVDVIGTYFGVVWLARMILTVLLISIWFIMNRRSTALGAKEQIPMLAASLALIATTSMVGHGAATEQSGALILDYIHNLVAAVWIGGIIYFAFILHPSLSKLGPTHKEKMSLVLIPRFSVAFIISVGIVIITGPTLLWFIDSDLGLITKSIFGQLIMAKIVIAAAMIGLGGFYQLKIQKGAEDALTPRHSHTAPEHKKRAGKEEAGTQTHTVHKRLQMPLRADVALGVILLVIVALLTNTTPPLAEVQDEAQENKPYGLNIVEFSENIRFSMEILPFSKGQNTILLKIDDPLGGPIRDVDQINARVSNPSKNIPPIQVQMTQITPDKEQIPLEFIGDLTFGFYGQWLVEIEAHRTQGANESVTMYLQVKPRLTEIQTQITEYQFPEDGKPLYPLYDNSGSIWISDTSAPRIWQFETDTQQFTPYTFDGAGTTLLSHDPINNRIWFTDTPSNQIGFIDTITKQITTTKIPLLEPTTSDNSPLSIQVGPNANSVWITIINKNAIMRYTPDSDTFEVVLLQASSLPFALAMDHDGTIWYTATGTGAIGSINPSTNTTTEIPISTTLQSPEAILFDGDGAIWVAEHAGQAITRIDPILHSVKRVAAPDQNSLPFGMTLDMYGNIWFAQHVTDYLGVYDPANGDLTQVMVPTISSATQFVTSDSDHNIWFVQQQANKLGMVEITEEPSSIMTAQLGYDLNDMPADDAPIYTVVASPLIALGIIFTSLFYVKAIHDKRRLNSLLIIAL